MAKRTQEEMILLIRKITDGYVPIPSEKFDIQEWVAIDKNRSNLVRQNLLALIGQGIMWDGAGRIQTFKRSK